MVLERQWHTQSFHFGRNQTSLINFSHLDHCLVSELISLIGVVVMVGRMSNQLDGKSTRRAQQLDYL